MRSVVSATHKMPSTARNSRTEHADNDTKSPLVRPRGMNISQSSWELGLEQTSNLLTTAGSSAQTCAHNGFALALARQF